MSSSYKEAKELFVSNSTGGGILRINTVCLTALSTYALWTVAAPRILSGSSSRSSKIPIVEFIILVVPLLMALTCLSGHTLLLNGVLLFLFGLSTYAPGSPLHPPLSPIITKADTKPSTSQSESVVSSKGFGVKTYVTVYRAHMMLMTIISILAVDFEVFPREFAKAETWGTSLMDLGVGSFVFSLGIVSALPLFRFSKPKNILSELFSSLVKSAGVIALGVVRVIMVKGVDYPEHVSEYGIHWNFFFTLGVMPIAGSIIGRISSRIEYTWRAVIVTVVHQLLLSFTHLQDWALNASRVDLLSSNKEGIVSLPGYLAVYLLGIATGLYVLPPDPYMFSLSREVLPKRVSLDKKREVEDKRKKAWKAKPGKTASVLWGYTIVWWSSYGAVRWLGWDVSRRLANLPYVLWVAAFNTSFILAYLLIHTWTCAILPTSAGPRSSEPPAIFEAMNKNGLAIFLLANLLTGLVNISVQSMYATDLFAMSVMVLYLAAVTWVTWMLRHRRLRI